MPKQAIYDNLASGAIDIYGAVAALEKALVGKSEQKNAGVVYTPKNIAMPMAALAFSRLCPDPANPPQNLSALEPSCGRGSFAFALLDAAIDAAKRSPGADPAALCRHIASQMALYDIDADALDDFSRLWPIYCSLRGLGPLDPPKAHCADALSDPAAVSGNFALCIGNPPYVRFQNLSESARKHLRENFQSCKLGNPDLYYAFMELAARCSSWCLITPNSWLSNASAKALRRILAQSTLCAVDFKDLLVFAPVRAYTCVAYGERSAGSLPCAFPRQIPDPAPRCSFSTATPAIARAALGAAPWNPPSAAGPCLADIANIHSGIATLSDKTYILRANPDGAGNARFSDPLAPGALLKAPEAHCPVFLKLTKFSGQSDFDHAPLRILYPYGQGARDLSEAEFGQAAPDALAYLLRRKSALLARDKGKIHNYPAWFSYGRKQGLRTILGPCVALAGMSCGKLNFQSFTASAPFLFTSGFILTPKPGYDLRDIEKALGAPESWEWILQRGKAWAGNGKQYRSYGAKLIAALPLPAQSPDTAPENGQQEEEP